MEKYWIKNVHSAIRDISDLDFQKEVWLNVSDKWVSSFDEMINTLYDDNCFEDFVNNTKWEKSDLSTSLHRELVKLKEMIDSYEEPETDRQVLSDPEWHSITKQAKKVIDIWSHSSDAVPVKV